MKLDYLKLGLSNIRHRGLRSWLTMIGIFVGIAAVVALISVGQAMQNAITEEFNELGTDILIIQPLGAGFITAGEDNPSQLTERDEEIIARTSGVLETVGMVFRSARLDYKDDVNFQFVTGFPLETTEKKSLAERFTTIEVINGRMLEKGDKYKALAGWGYTVKDEVFPEIARPGSKISINGEVFEIVGTLKKIGSPPDDRQLIIPLETAEEVLEIGGENNAKVRDFLVAQVSPGIDPERVADSVADKLMNFRNLDEGEEDFEIQTPQQLLGSFNTILAVVQAVLVGIAAISLLVGGVGIMNTMYTAVLERTKEIGLMKAIGARNSDVLLIFLVESGMLGLVGGLIGVALGYLISAGITGVAAQYLGQDSLRTFFPWWLVLGGVLFSFLVGAVSGLLPARQASRMNPVDALRYE